MARRDDFIQNVISKTRHANGLPLTKETRQRMSLAASKRNAAREHSKGIGGTRSDIGHYVRSRWEANICRYFNYLYIPYGYETDTFLLQDGEKLIHYTPDFRIGPKYIEVKGWWDERSKKKKRLMLEQYPQILVEYIDESRYTQLEREYKMIIPNWEIKIRIKKGGQ